MKIISFLLHKADLIFKSSSILLRKKQIFYREELEGRPLFRTQIKSFIYKKTLLAETMEIVRNWFFRHTIEAEYDSL